MSPCRCGVYKFNLGTGTGATVLEVIRAFSSVVGKEIPHVLAGRRKGDVDSLYASCDLAEKVTSHHSPDRTALYPGCCAGAGVEVPPEPDGHVS